MTTDTLLNIALAVGLASVAWLLYELLAIRSARRRQRRAAERAWAERLARRAAGQAPRRAAWE